MKKKDLAQRLAEETRTTESAAADALDDAIHGVIRNLKHSRPRQPKPNALERLIKEADCSPARKGHCAQP